MRPLPGQPLAVGLVGAVLASLCCAAPVLLVSLGLATSSFLLAWLDLKPFFLVLAGVFLCVGLGYALLRSRRLCSRTRFRRRLLIYPLVTVLSFVAGYWLLMDVATPRLYGTAYASQMAAVQRGGAVREPDGTIVPLHRVEFSVQMGCDGCMATLRAVLAGLPGVHAAAIDPRRAVASVLYDPTRTNVRSINHGIPYRWYFKPRLLSELSLAARAAPAQPTDGRSALLTLLAAMTASTSLAAGGVWIAARMPNAPSA